MGSAAAPFRVFLRVDKDNDDNYTFERELFDVFDIGVQTKHGRTNKQPEFDAAHDPLQDYIDDGSLYRQLVEERGVPEIPREGPFDILLEITGVAKVVWSPGPHFAPDEVEEDITVEITDYALLNATETVKFYRGPNEFGPEPKNHIVDYPAELDLPRPAMTAERLQACNELTKLAKRYNIMPLIAKALGDKQ